MRKRLKLLLFLALVALCATTIFAILVKCQPLADRNARLRWPFPTNGFGITGGSRLPACLAGRQAELEGPAPTKIFSPSVSPLFSPSPFPLPTTDYRPASPARLAKRAGGLLTISFVHDGDTIYTREFKEGVRIIGIDAPEMANSYKCTRRGSPWGTPTTDCSQDECGATQAKEKLAELVLNREVYLVEDEFTKPTDVYGRLLRYVFLCRGVSFDPPEGQKPSSTDGQAPVFVKTTAGSQEPYPTDSSSTDYRLPTTDSSCQDIGLALLQQGLAREASFGSAYEKREEYRQAQTEAKETKAGIWGKCE